LSPLPTSSPPARYRIGAVARATGIGTDTLRVWERRYQVVMPTRTPGGGRLYDDDDVARLRLIKRLVDRGHAISQVAVLEQPQLVAMLALFDQGERGLDLVEVRSRFLAAIDTLDVVGGQQILGRAALLLGPRTLTLEVIAPLLQEIGDRWESGSTSVHHEHAASAIVRTVVGGLVATQIRPLGAQKILFATPSRELHEFGALLAALLAGAARWDVFYLGPNLPTQDILDAVSRGSASAVGLSVVNSLAAATEKAVEDLVDRLPATVALVAGGRMARKSRALRRRALVFEDLETFDGWLQRGGKNEAP
jgi:methylmalonyl-CoA mutase cobalamin-binding subunit